MKAAHRPKRLTVKNTSRYPDAEVTRLVRLALADLDTTGVHVNVKNSRGARRGYAYRHVPAVANVPAGTRYLVTIGIGDPSHFPRDDGYWNSHARNEGTPRRGGVWPEKHLRHWQDALVSVVAHEGKHVEQFRERKPLSEVACEHHAAWVLRRYQESYPQVLTSGR